MEQGAGADIRQAGHHGMVPTLGVPSHRKDPEIPVDHGNRPCGKPVDDLFRQGLLADGLASIHRPPSGA